MTEMEKIHFLLHISHYDVDTSPCSSCISPNDLQTNIITIGQFQKNMVVNVHIIASEVV